MLPYCSSGSPTTAASIDGRVGAQRLFDLEGHDLLATAIDHVVDASEHVNRAVVIS